MLDTHRAPPMPNACVCTATIGVKSRQTEYDANITKNELDTGGGTYVGAIHTDTNVSW